MTATRKLRWGILGVARINRRLVPALRQSGLADLRAIASRDLNKARLAAADAGIPTAHGSYEALLADPDVEAVYIPLPNALHAEWTRKSADAGKHVLCEKPLAPNAVEARAVVDHCKGRGVRLLEGYMWPHHPRTARIRELIDGGAIGTVHRVTGPFTFPLPLDAGNIRLNPQLAGGSLLDVGCYPVYAIRWAFGAEPVRVYATANFHQEVDVEVNGILWLADGRVGTFDCGFTAPHRTWLEIVGTKGVIHVPRMYSPNPQATFTLTREGHEPETHTIDHGDQILHMVDHFSQAVLTGSPVRPDPEEGVRNLAVLDALARSAREGRPVDVA